MSDLTLRTIPSPSPTSQKPIPTDSLLSPWKFKYSSSPDTKDLNLLILFHGLGDTLEPFFQLGQKLRLPSTAVLSLQAPDRIPLLEEPAYSWYNTFTPLFEPLPNPNPTTIVQSLRKLIETLTSPEVGWKSDQIHLFGFGQGGTVCLESALDLGRNPLSDSNRRFGSIVAICAGLLSFPTTSLDLESPCLIFSRLDGKSQSALKLLTPVQKTFRTVKVVTFQGEPESMPRNREEWEGIMAFWAQVLAKDDAWKGQGEVYEIVR